MKISKGQRFLTKRDKEYEVVGRWGKDIVLSPTTATDEECLIYTQSEMEEFLKTGYLKESEAK